MKKTIEHTIILQMSFLIYCCIPHLILAQVDSSKKEERTSLVYLQFRVKNNQIPYLNVQTKNKVGKKFYPQAKVPIQIFLDKDSDPDALVGDMTTNNKGEASIWIPGKLASIWSGATTHTFFAHAKASQDFDSTTEEITVAPARLEVDTVKDGEGRAIEARLLKKEDSSMVPMAGVDIRITVRRLGGYLNIGDEETYTTDSTGKVQAEFKREKLPGDSLGNLEVVAIVDDNDEVGSFETALIVPWGVAPAYESEFGQRSLWATGNRAPIWLMVMAYGCIIAIWSVIIYLITRIVKIKKLGVRQVKS